MSWFNVKLIFLRELRDQLRDRRTLFMIIVLPLLLYPSIGIGLVQFTVLFTEQPRQVAVRGTEYLPASPPLVNQMVESASGAVRKNFVPQLFDVEEEATQLEIVETTSDDDARRMLATGEVQVILQIPATLRDRIESGQDFRFELSYKSADEKSRIAYLRLKEALENWKRVTIQQRLESKGLPRDFANPSAVEVLDIATPQQLAGGLIWAKLFPFLLVVMSLTGAFYPAVDLCAGEKERGTIETLLISPAGRGDIVLGKYFTICIFSVGTAVLNLLSMATTGWVIARQMKSALPANAPLGMLSPPSLADAGWILLLLLPLAAFFSALGIALAAFARSTKEGQYYLTPLFLVTMPLVLVTVAPGIELNGFNSVVPVTGAALLLKTLIQGQYDLALQFFVPVLLPTILYAVLALRWAIDQFNREEVLFREAERLDLLLWARHVFRDKGPFPSAAEALFCFSVMLLLVWFLGGFLTPAPAADEAVRQAALQRSLIVMQLAFVATPAVMMALMLTTSVRQTLLLRRSAWKYIGLSLLLAVALHPIMVELSQFIHRGLTQPKWVTDQIRQLLGAGQPIWWQLALVAVLPAVCEELAFRGFILSGLLRRVSPATAIVLSAFLFGFFHINPQQLLPATMLGCVLGLIATRSGSLLPGILFHVTNNSLALLMANLQDHLQQTAPTGNAEASLFWLFRVLYRQPSPQIFSFQVPYSIAVLAICTLVATAALTWLLKQPLRAPAALDTDDANPTDERTASKGASHTPSSLTRLAAGLGSLTPERRDVSS
jgi:sodium transport system permease protein